MALKIVYRICCGIDVHKSFLVACIATTDNKGVTTYQRKRFSTFTKDLRKLAEWLSSNNCYDVCMESTGKYWIPVFNVLELSCNVILAHPKYVRAIRGKKTDEKDAKWIADIFKHGLVAASFIPPLPIRMLRDLVRYRNKLTAIITGEKNRAQNCLTVCNIHLDEVFTDVFGKSASAITEQLLQHPNGDFDVAPFVDRRVKAPLEEIQSSIEGSLIPEQADKLRIIRSHMASLHDCRDNLDAAISTLSEDFSTQCDLLMTVPGIQKQSAVAIIAEIGLDMSVFPTAKHLCSWAGLVPQNNESGGKKKTTRISQAGVYIKPLLVQCAQAIVRSEKHPEFRQRYLALKKRRGPKKAILAICRMMLTAIYAILSKMEPYKPFSSVALDAPPAQRVLTVEQAILWAKRHGFAVILPTTA